MVTTRADKLTQGVKQSDKVIFSDFMTNFTKHPETDQLVRLTNSEAIKKSVRNLILTNKGERLFQPDIGCNIDSLLFEPMSPEVEDQIAAYINNALTNYEPRAMNPQVYVNGNYDTGQYVVAIVFDIINNPKPVILNVVLDRVR